MSCFFFGIFYLFVFFNLGNVELFVDGYVDVFSIFFEFFWVGSMVDFFDIVEGFVGLYGKERELVLGWWDRFDKVW